MDKKIYILIILSLPCFCMKSIAQQLPFKPDISKSKNFGVVNRNISIGNDHEKIVVHLDSKEGNGVSWLNNITFQKGIIEFDVKGKNVVQQSFVGIAFHGMNDTTYDAVYFRPFNFQSPDMARKNHSVQYISMPQYDWYILRQNFTGVYEKALTSAINADAWFHAKIVVDADSIKVFVNNDAVPSLTVKPLNHYANGKIGFWVGNNADGDFSNLSIKKISNE